MSVKTWIRNITNPPQEATLYSKVHHEEPPSESTETLLNSPLPPPHKRPSYILTVANLTLFVTSILLITHAYTRPVTDAQCVRQLYTWCKFTLPTKQARAFPNHHQHPPSTQSNTTKKTTQASSDKRPSSAASPPRKSTTAGSSYGTTASSTSRSRTGRP